MKKYLLIGLIALLLIGGGLATYFFVLNKKVFAPVPTIGLSYVATITPQPSDSSAIATITSDGKGTIQYSASAGSGEKAQITYTADAYYICGAAPQCFKSPAGQKDSSGFDPGTYAFASTQLADYKKGAVYKGHQSCQSGTCNIWDVASNGTKATLFIDSSTKRITEADTTTKGKTSKIVYDYKNVSITIPANAMTLPIPSNP